MKTLLRCHMCEGAGRGECWVNSLHNLRISLWSPVTWPYSSAIKVHATVFNLVTPHFSFGFPPRATGEGRFSFVIQHLCFDVAGGSALPRQRQDAVIDSRHLHGQSYRVLVFTWAGGVVLEESKEKRRRSIGAQLSQPIRRDLVSPQFEKDVVCCHDPQR